MLPVSRDAYGEQVRDVRLFLDGKSDELLDRLRSRMKDAAGRMEFEVAADIRDQVRALEVTLEEQRVVSTDFVDQDVIGYHREGIALELAVMSIRGGKLTGSRTFSFTGQEFPDAELISSFMGLYYDLGAAPPDEVLLPIEIEDAALKAEWLSERRAALPGRKRKVEVLVPQRGDRRRLVELASKNAAASFATRRNARADLEIALGKLQRRLKLARLPRVIECYDVSHLQGFATVASMVVFVDGRPDKTRYRTYKVRAPGSAGDARRNDDFASMYEVLSRRFRRAREADAHRATAEGAEPQRAADTNSWKLPDLIVVDGGKGQLAMALAAARDVGIDIRPGVGLPIVALAKEREVAAEPAAAAVAPTDAMAQTDAAAAVDGVATADAAPVDSVTEAAAPVEAASAAPMPIPPKRRQPKSKSDGEATRPDRVFLPQAKDAIPIRANSAEMFILQQLRDEAHRFAVSFHRGQRRRLTLRSSLSGIPGIGAGRQRQLLRHFGSLKRVREASADELAAVPGMTRTAADAVFQHWARQPVESPAAPREGSTDTGAGEQAEQLAVADAFSNVESDDGLTGS